MSWRDELRPASFRGVAFQVEGESGTFGRRTQVHEFPQRDKPYAEDLGRATRNFEFTAFLVGPDYLAQRDALLAALEQEGPGTLVHPWYGELSVSIKDPARVSHSRANGGMCEVALSFVEAGELSFPAASTSLGARTLDAADELGEVAAEDFAEVFSLEDVPSSVQDAFEADLAEFSSFLEDAASGWVWLNVQVPDWAGDALAFAQGVISMFDRAVLPEAISGADRRNRNAVLSLAALAGQYTAQVAGPTSLVASTRQRQINRAALAGLFAQATLIQAAGMTAAMSLPVYDDAAEVRDSVTTALDEATFTAPDRVYPQLVAVRAAVFADITARMSNAARLLTYTPRQPMPALVLTYDLYEDVDREQEIVDRNGIRHAGFLPARPLKVLSA
ncbi:DNA circularization protein [uncultured Pseudacidovorax sp.]|uniref:DNA circularization protein n=1 Tax=uncultured Pseudacidovorax sp. TaxID=679313 RepID=UPI0025F6412E|nr:DNA circularization N-terminal domain-containing protein [uncultured Pseudacidovorax sp.]